MVKQRFNVPALAGLIVLALREHGRHSRLPKKDGSFVNDPDERELTSAELRTLIWPACRDAWMAGLTGEDGEKLARTRFKASFDNACAALSSAGVLNQIEVYEDRPTGAAQRALLSLPGRGPLGHLYVINLRTLRTPRA